jgi:hypothetical protein
VGERVLFVVYSVDPNHGTPSVYFAGIAPKDEQTEHAANWARDKFRDDGIRVELRSYRAGQSVSDWGEDLEIMEYRTGGNLWDHLAARTRIWRDSYR